MTERKEEGFMEGLRKAYLFSPNCLGSDGLGPGTLEAMTGISPYLQRMEFDRNREYLREYFAQRPQEVYKALMQVRLHHLALKVSSELNALCPTGVADEAELAQFSGCLVKVMEKRRQYGSRRMTLKLLVEDGVVK